MNKLAKEQKRKERQARYRLEGRCIACGKLRDPGGSTIYCGACLAKRRARSKRIYSRGLGATLGRIASQLLDVPPTDTTAVNIRVISDPGAYHRVACGGGYRVIRK